MQVTQTFMFSIGSYIESIGTVQSRQQKSIDTDQLAVCTFVFHLILCKNQAFSCHCSIYSTTVYLFLFTLKIISSGTD